MNIRKIKNMFKEPIYKEDLIKVIKNGLITVLLYGLLIGGLSYVITVLLKLPINIELIAIAFVVSNAVAKSYYNPHILYPILSILFFILTLFVSTFTSLFVMTFDFSNILNTLYHSFLLLIEYFNPFIQFRLGVIGILNFAVLIYLIYFTFQRSKNNYY